jgi:hypothetical protein
LSLVIDKLAPHRLELIRIWGIACTLRVHSIREAAETRNIEPKIGKWIIKIENGPS